VISPILRDFPDSFSATWQGSAPGPPHMLNAGAAESRKKRNRLRAKARRRLRLVEDIPIAAHMEGVALTDDEWRTIEKLARHAEHLLDGGGRQARRRTEAPAAEGFGQLTDIILHVALTAFGVPRPSGGARRR
jgi:hypothetical protein